MSKCYAKSKYGLPCFGELSKPTTEFYYFDGENIRLQPSERFCKKCGKREVYYKHFSRFGMFPYSDNYWMEVRIS